MKNNSNTLMTKITQLLMVNHSGITSMRTLRRKDLTQMTDTELTDYIYEQLSSWPVELSNEEKGSLLGVMKASVEKMRVMNIEPAERKRELEHRKENREKIQAFNEELKKPKLQSMILDV